MAMVYAMSHQIHTLVASDGWDKKAMVKHKNTAFASHKTMVMSKEVSSDKVHLGLFEVAMFEEDHHGYPDWINSLFDDDNDSYNDEEDVQDYDHADLDIDAFDETSVIDIIRNNREAEGLEFNMEDDIDEACDMFIRRCRSRMNLRF
ncbi:hypothetical protein HU200_000804 [Digitaria exilis]|uniref:Uncharacterized protein n=1 Tax=Digitaria exilis TaxID=1010633 RepID=A0A835G1V5_9POAL|nr:hypothetical protein HU200_000804 [Digitaria exilis]